MSRSALDIQLTNNDMASIYDYLHGSITQEQLGKELNVTRTNTYYYIGRAMAYWLKTNRMQFINITSQSDLGGKEIPDGDVQDTESIQ